VFAAGFVVGGGGGRETRPTFELPKDALSRDV
jgi:hypothetical protein